MQGGIFGIGLVVVIGLFLFSRWINILNEYERAVTFWLGRLSQKPKGPGLVLIFWPLEKMINNDLYWASENNKRILAEWQKRYDSKSAPKK